MSTKKPKPGARKNPVRKPTVRQRGFVKNLIQGKSARESALNAGYSESVANNATTELLMKPSVQELVRKALETAGITEQILGQRMKEGLDAKETKFFQFQGDITATRSVIDFGQRLAYATIIFKLIGALTDKVEHSGTMTWGEMVEKSFKP